MAYVSSSARFLQGMHIACMDVPVALCCFGMAIVRDHAGNVGAACQTGHGTWIMYQH